LTQEHTQIRVSVRVMEYNATFNNISVTGENYRPVASH
jgi:hypothetical protein